MGWMVQCALRPPIRCFSSLIRSPSVRRGFCLPATSSAFQLDVRPTLTRTRARRIVHLLSVSTAVEGSPESVPTNRRYRAFFLSSGGRLFVVLCEAGMDKCWYLPSYFLLHMESWACWILHIAKSLPFSFPWVIDDRRPRARNQDESKCNCRLVCSMGGQKTQKRSEVERREDLGGLGEVVPQVSPKYRVVAAMGGFADVEIWTMRECKSLQYAISTSWLHSAPAEWVPPIQRRKWANWAWAPVVGHLLFCSIHCVAALLAAFSAFEG